MSTNTTNFNSENKNDYENINPEKEKEKEKIFNLINNNILGKKKLKPLCLNKPLSIV